MQALIQFMNGPIGRIARIVLGLALLWFGLTSMGGTVGYVIALVGVVAMAMGAMGRCLIEFVPGAS